MLDMWAMHCVNVMTHENDMNIDKYNLRIRETTYPT